MTTNNQNEGESMEERLDELTNYQTDQGDVCFKRNKLEAFIRAEVEKAEKRILGEVTDAVDATMMVYTAQPLREPEMTWRMYTSILRKFTDKLTEIKSKYLTTNHEQRIS